MQVQIIACHIKTMARHVLQGSGQ